MFCIYVNDIINEINLKYRSVEVQAFMDDMLLQNEVIEEVQEAFGHLVIRMKEENLEVNPDKCELVTDEEKDYVLDPTTRSVIPFKPMAKYLCQYINS